MVVDDNIDFAFSLSEILKDENYTVECRHSGEDAIEAFAQHDFDVVLLDMKLPRISGVEVFFEIRKIKPEITVLMMSGHSVTDLMAQAVDGGTYRIFYQSIRHESLAATLGEMRAGGLALVVDDDSGIVDSIQQALDADGFSVLVHAGGREVIEKVLADAPDFLVLDQQRPIVQGFEIYWELKQLDRTLPTLIVTPRPDDDYVTIEKLNQFSVCGYFIKPFNPFELLPVLAATAG